MSAQNLSIVLQLLVIAGGLIYPPLHLAAESRAKEALAAEWMEQGTDAYRRGHFEEAVTYLDKAAHGYEQEGAQSAQSQALARKAEADLALGRSEQAIAALSLALELAETTKARSEQVSMLGRLGTAYLQVGRIEEARRQLEASVESARVLKNPSVTATSLNNLGTLFASQRHYEQALKHYLESAKLAEQANDHTMAAKALTNAARVSLSKPNGPNPESLLVSAHEHIKRADDSHDKAFVLMSLGQLYRRLQGSDPHPSQRAYDALTSALSIAEAIDDKRALSYAVGYLGALYEEQSRFDEASRLTRRAEFIAQAIHSPEILYRWQWQIGRILDKQGNITGAIAAYQLAVSILQPIRQELLTTYRASDLSFRDSVGAIYFELADLLLRRHVTSHDPKQNLQDLVEARRTVELMKAVEIEDYFQDDCVAALQAKTKGVDQLALQTAALYPIILPDRMELLLSLPSGMRLTTVDETGEPKAGSRSPR
jgi:tetratricopeptide (TPR) repeat protein